MATEDDIGAEFLVHVLDAGGGANWVIRSWCVHRAVTITVRASLSRRCGSDGEADAPDVNATFPNLETALPGLIDVPIIGIVRRLPPGLVPEVARAAFDAGLRYLEVTMDSDDALGVIAKLRRNHHGVGVGSVTRLEQVTRARDAGAVFVVSPITDRELIRASVESGLPAFPGAATPSEIDLALASGATAVKVFPAEQLGGPAYIKAIMSPLGNPPLIPTGGVTLPTPRSTCGPAP